MLVDTRQPGYSRKVNGKMTCLADFSCSSIKGHVQPVDSRVEMSDKTALFERMLTSSSVSRLERTSFVSDGCARCVHQ